MSLITFTLSINEEKKPGMGEDSFMYHTAGPNSAIIASIDGSGGSGGVHYPTFHNWSGARIASRLIGRALSDWFTEKSLSDPNHFQKPAEKLAEEIHNAISLKLQQAKAQLPESNETELSRLSRLFPSTMTAVLLDVKRNNLCRICSFWAGDSRTYFFPVSGLQQTSRDDIRRNPDPFDSLFNDGIMSNLVCADKDFQIHVAENWSSDPCMVLTATDGCFSYFPSPMHLEWILLDSLIHAQSPIAWEEDIKNIIGSIAGDDYTMQIAVVGFSNFKALQTAYTPRYCEFMKKYAAPLKYILEHNDQEAHHALWLEYKQGHMV